jgi:tRNA U34 5-methylaminomethyl-2-thiouridine-forming methyltransferase MnmC
MDTIRIITTADGSHSLLNEQLNETYHSVHGAMQESRYVFIKNGLEFLLEKNQTHPVHILEVGYGTGLNALLTLQQTLNTSNHIFYTSLEAFPVEENVWRSLNYTESEKSKILFEKLHCAAWNEWVSISSAFELRKLQTTLQNVRLEPNHFDLVYFDAFAPNKQPELWEIEVLRKVTGAMKPQGIFVTYCAKGQLKRDLKSLGLMVESLPGPPGKREMVRATKN